MYYYSPCTAHITASLPRRSLQTKCSISAKPHTRENNHRSFSVYSQHFSIFQKPCFSSYNSVFVGQLPLGDWEAHEGELELLGHVFSWEMWSPERSCSSLDINDHVLHVPWNHGRVLGQLGKNCQGWNVHRSLGLSLSKPSVFEEPATEHGTLSYAKRYQRSSWIIQKDDVQGLNLAFTFDIKRSPTEACHTNPTNREGLGLMAQSPLHCPTTFLGMTAGHPSTKEEVHCQHWHPLVTSGSSHIFLACK